MDNSVGRFVWGLGTTLFRDKSMSSITSLREVIPAELEREEDCWNKMPTTRRDVPRIILVEADCLGNAAVCYTVYAAKTTTFDFSATGVGRGDINLGQRWSME